MLSVTYDVQSRYTYAVLYGCQPTMRETFIERLDAVEAGAFHPMLLPTVFADLERDRQVGHARTLRAQLVSKGWNIPALPNLSSSADNEQGMQRKLVEYSTSGDTLSLWTKMRGLKNGLHDWQDQISVMIEHIDTTCAEELRPLYLMDDDSASSNSERTPINTHSVVPEDLSLVSVEDGMRKFGIRIRHRLCEIHQEYLAEMRKCSATLDVTSLASQIVSTIYFLP